MKAYLLAGGRGERLRPLTLERPKCLAPVNGVPLLDTWLALCDREAITDVLLNVSHHVSLVERFLAASRHRVRVHLVVEADPRGSATTVVSHRDFVGDDESFWIFYADNLTDMRLAPMARLHASHAEAMTMAVFEAENPRAAGIVVLGPDGRVEQFAEKPERPLSTLANAGVYLARRQLFEVIPSGRDGVDFAFDVLPRLIGRMYAYVVPDFLMDVGTPAALAHASRLWAARLVSAEGAPR